MKLLDFFSSEFACFDPDTHCSRNTCGRVNPPESDFTAEPPEIFKKQHPWCCKWRLNFPEEYTFAAANGCISYVDCNNTHGKKHCIQLSRKGSTIYRQLRGDFE